MDATERFLKVCRREEVDRPPVWLMRQAGRYMSTYQAVRKRVSFMELCRSPELCTEVAMMPIDQLGVDAAILFSDILVPLEPMGAKVFFDGKGPHVEPPVRSVADIERMRSTGVADDVGFVYEALSQIKTALGGRAPLLGFSGAPWTLATYLVEGGTSRNHHNLRELMYAEPEALELLLDKLTTVIIEYLRHQIDAGADAVQIFDTWGGALTEAQWRRFSGRFTKRVFEALADTGVPRIHFVQGGAHLLAATAELPCEVLSVDWRQPLEEVLRVTGGRYALQGNMDPGVLRAPAAVIGSEVRAVMDSYGSGPGHIMNLGHGITPDVTVDAARAMVDSAQSHGANR